jgi:phage-related protein
MADNEVTVVVNGKDNASATMNQAKESASGLTGTLGELGKIAGGVGLEQIGEKGFDFLKDSVTAAQDAEAAQGKLKQAVIDTGASWDASAASVNGAIDGAEKMGFSANSSRNALALLEAQTSSVTEAQKRFTLAQDLSRGTSMDLETASRLLGKVTDTNVTALQRYGVHVAKGATETELFAAVQAKFGGQAEVFANSSAGSMAKVKIQIEELKVAIGEKLLPVITTLASFFADKVAPAIANFITQVADGIGDFKDWAASNEQVQDALAKVEDVLAAVNPKVQEFIGYLKDHQTEVKIFAGVVGGVLVVAFTAWAVSAGLAAAATLLALAPIIAVGVALGLLAIGIYEVVKHWDVIKAKTMEVVNFIKDFVEEHWKLIALAIMGPMGLIVIAVVDHWDAIKNKTMEAFDFIKNVVSMVVAFISDFIKEHWDTISAVFEAALGAIMDVVKVNFEFIKTIVTTAFSVVSDIFKIAMAIIDGDWGKAWDGIKQLVSDAWEGIKTAVAGPIDYIIGKIQDLIDKAKEITHLGGVPGKILSSITDHFADGGVSVGGLAIVGEGGPELVNLPGGSTVYSNIQSRQMLAGGQQAGNTVVNVYINTYQHTGDATAGLAALGGMVA